MRKAKMIRMRSVTILRVISRAPSSLKSESMNMIKTFVSDTSISFTLEQRSQLTKQALLMHSWL